jgi:hypothetical protein
MNTLSNNTPKKWNVDNYFQVKNCSLHPKKRNPLRSIQKQPHFGQLTTQKCSLLVVGRYEMMGESKEREGGHAEAMLQPCCTSHDAVPALSAQTSCCALGFKPSLFVI